MWSLVCSVRTLHLMVVVLDHHTASITIPALLPLLSTVVHTIVQVKTQRALNDYRKSAYPHYRDELTRLRYIGAITATRLKDARAWLGKDVPEACVDSVQSLKTVP